MLNLCSAALLTLLAPTVLLAAAPAQGQPKPAAPRQPHIVILLADDWGFSDVGSFGAEFATPNIDALAFAGTRFSNFHVAGSCSPTRAMLQTGVMNHRNGLGNMPETIPDEHRGKPGYDTVMNHRVVTIAQLLKALDACRGVADVLADMETHPGLMASETRRQEEQLGHFNSSFVVSAQGEVLAVSTSYPQLRGQHMTSDAARTALTTRRPFISEPFRASNGRWLILYTHPIFSRDYRYLGYIAGTLYLHEDNVLDRLLGQHFNRDDPDPLGHAWP